MKIVRSSKELVKDRNSVVTVGTFDGVHLAHQEIIRDVVNRARVREGRSVVLTFDPHPKEVVTSSKGEIHLLTTIEERIALFRMYDIDLLYIVPFTKEFSRLPSRDFYHTYVVDGVGVGEVVVGYDHMFGRDREAGIEELVRMGQEFDFSVFAVHAFTVDGETVSSTRIRKALMSGDLPRGRRLLGHDYRLEGTVVRGEGRGARIGYPTANIEPHSGRKLMPARGVYIAGVDVRGKACFGMVNIGIRPTFMDGAREIMEVHILDFEGDIYGEHVGVTFLRKLRDERRFDSVEELIGQLGKDRKESERFIRTFVGQP